MHHETKGQHGQQNGSEVVAEEDARSGRSPHLVPIFEELDVVLGRHRQFEIARDERDDHSQAKQVDSPKSINRNDKARVIKWSKSSSK